MAGLKETLAKPESKVRMRQVDVEVAKAVVQFRENTEAAIVVFALTRVAKQLLDKYPPNTRRTLLQEVIIPYLYGEHREEGLIIQ